MSLRNLRTLPLLVICSILVCAPSTRSQPRKAVTNDPLSVIERNIERGNLTEAEGPLFDYAVAHPRDVRALELLASLRLRQNRLNESEALYRRVLTIEPTRDQAKVYLAHVVYRSGRQQESRDLLVEVAKSSLNDPRVRMSLVEGLMQVGEYEKSLAETDKLPASWKNSVALPVVAANQLALGERQKLLALIPSMQRVASDAFIAVRCIQVLQNAGLTNEAIALARKAIMRSPNDVNLLIVVARLESVARNFSQARRHLNRAASIDPRSSEIFSTLAALENAEGNVTAALSNLQKARALSPHSSTVLAQLTVTAMRANQPGLAADAAKDLLTEAPDDSESLYLFGAASLQNGSLLAARDALERYVKQKPNDARGCLALGITLAAEKNELLAARSQFQRCLQLDAANVEAKYQLGLLSKSEGETATAIKLFEEVIARAPDHANALRDVGSLYLQSNDDPKARSVLERAVVLNPQDAETHFLLSRVYNRLGESVLASRHLQLFQKIKNPTAKLPTP